MARRIRTVLLVSIAGLALSAVAITWLLDRGEQLFDAPRLPLVAHDALLVDGRLLTAALDGGAVARVYEDDRVIAVLRGHAARLVSARFVRDEGGRLMLVTSDETGETRRSDLAMLRRMPTLEREHLEPLRGLLWNTFGRELSKAAKDAKFRIQSEIALVMQGLEADPSVGEVVGDLTLAREFEPSSCASGVARAAPVRLGRHALLIGNQSYEFEAKLTHSFGNVERLCQSLEQLGFQVTVMKDLGRGEIFDAIWNYVTLVDEAPADAVSFFYYSGHGASIAEQGDSFLIPVEADISGPQDVKEHGYNLNDLVVHLSGIRGAFQKSNFVVLDASTSIVTESGSKPSRKGFVPVRDYGGVFVAFAAGPGQYALDEPYYSQALARSLLDPNRTAYQIFRSVRQTVYELTEGEQSPWTSDGLRQDIILK